MRRPFLAFLFLTFTSLALFAPLPFMIGGCDPTKLQAPTTQDEEANDGFPDDAGDGADTPPIGFADEDASEDAPVSTPPSLPSLPWSGDDDDDVEDASVPVRGPPFDAGPDGACTGPLAEGDLAIVEILVASLSGTGDHGEWLEVRSTRDCALDLRTLHGECALGVKVTTVDVTDDVWLPARGSFVLADSTDPAVNHALPGLVLGWDGDPGDVLRNQGTTVTLLAGGLLIDSITYPPSKVPDGVSLAFPSDCPTAVRSDWSTWQVSSASWFPGFRGTPNAPNVDVRCPDD